MYMQTSEDLGQNPQITTTKTKCPSYKSGEIQISKTKRGHLTPDVSLIAPGRLLIADFGVGWRSIKKSIKGEKLLKDWLNIFETDPSYRLRIIGYSDCVGREKNNRFLRHGRAKRVYQLLGKNTRPRVVFVGPASTGSYVADNNTIKGRAMNRGVIIEFRQEIVFDVPEKINAVSLKQVRQRAFKLLKEQKRVGVILSPEQTRRIGCFMLRMGWRGVDDRYVTAQMVLTYYNQGKPDIRFIRLKDVLMRSRLFGARVSDKSFLRLLKEIDEEIIRGRHKVNQLFAQQGKAVSHGVQWLKDWIAGREKDRLSIYRCYR